MNDSVEAVDFLNSHNTGVVTTVSKQGELWSSTVYYVSDEHSDIYFFTKNDTRKYHNLSEDSRIAFIVYDQKERETFQLSGEATVVTEQKIINLIYNKLQRATPLESRPLPIEKLLNAGEYTLIKITAKQTNFVDYSKPANIL